MTTVVMTGGGFKNHYTTGCVLYLRSKGLEPNKYVGISGGALNAFLFSQIEPHAISDEAQKIKGLSSVFRFKWDCLWSHGVFSTTPLEKTIRRLLRDSRLPKDKRVPGVVSYVDIYTGVITYKDVNTLADEDIIESVLSAVSIPGLIDPPRYPKIDAGVVEINPVTYAVSKGDKSIAVILDRPMEGSVFIEPKGFLKVAKNGLRAIEIMMHTMCVDDILSGALNNVGADIQLFEPIQDLGGALDASKSQYFLEEGLKGRYKRTDVVKAMRSLAGKNETNTP